MLSEDKAAIIREAASAVESTLSIATVEKQHRLNLSALGQSGARPRNVERFCIDSLLQNVKREHERIWERNVGVGNCVRTDALAMNLGDGSACVPRKRKSTRVGSALYHYINQQTNGATFATAREAKRRRRQLAHEFKVPQNFWSVPWVCVNVPVVVQQ